MVVECGKNRGGASFNALIAEQAKRGGAGGQRLGELDFGLRLRPAGFVHAGDGSEMLVGLAPAGPVEFAHPVLRAAAGAPLQHAGRPFQDAALGAGQLLERLIPGVARRVMPDEEPRSHRVSPPEWRLGGAPRA